jgi:hypothetical protein
MFARNEREPADNQTSKLTKKVKKNKNGYHLIRGFTISSLAVVFGRVEGAYDHFTGKDFFSGKRVT